MEIFCIEQFGFQYPQGDTRVLNQIQLKIQTGEFIVLCGPSGCGKTTLLRHLKSGMTPHGNREGMIWFHGKPLEQISLREQTEQIGFVGQNPEDSIATDKVWHELAFGLENLGVDNSIIQKRVAEMSHFFGIQEWFHQNTASLSGGQKQLLNLASVMVMQPEIILLDEPTSQLDPIAAAEFLTMLGRIHRELGTTILLTEHRLEEVLPYCSRFLVMDDGKIQFDGILDQIVTDRKRQKESLVSLLPAPMRIWNALEKERRACPQTVQEGREWFAEWWENHKEQIKEPDAEPERGKDSACTVELKDIWFRYEKRGKEILQGVSLYAYSGELLALLGGNGSGKSTLLSVIAGESHPQRGKVAFPVSGNSRVMYLPQNPQLLFIEESVKQELEEMKPKGGLSKEEKEEWQKQLEYLISICKLENLLQRHPYDLSGGEQQRLALAKILLLQPQILLLDEPTKGLDYEYKKSFGTILKQLLKQGVTILMVSHDVEFCAEYADKCGLLFDGRLAAIETPKKFFSENHFYTTSVNRMVRQILPQAITVEDVLQACGSNWKAENNSKDENNCKDRDENFRNGNFQSERKTEQGIVSANSLKGQADTTPLSIHTWMGILITLVAIPFTIFAGMHFWNNEKYLFISLLILVECMLPFFLAFEGRKPTARRVVLLSVLCALGVAGRAVFAMLPHFKPMTAIAIIAGVAYGGETGFLVGAVTMLVSNMLFGQGPWTPWQMFAMGMTGFLAGILFHNTSMESGKGGMLFLLYVYGFLAAVILYGGIMNLSTAIFAGAPFAWSSLVVYYLSGLPFNLIHGVATVLFLLLGAKPMFRKIRRVKVKFG